LLPGLHPLSPPAAHPARTPPPLPGKNLLDGRYTCFGYTVEGADDLRAVKVGDVIVSAKVLDGEQLLKTS